MNKERPILFSSEMVRAILEGRKTVTRRMLKPQPPPIEDVVRRCGSGYGIFTNERAQPAFRVSGPVWTVRELLGAEPYWLSPYGVPGDCLWVRETHYRFGHWEPVPGVKTKTGRMKWRFVADFDDVLFDPPACVEIRGGRHHRDPDTPAWHKRLGRFMPRAFARLTLEVVSVRVERVQEITPMDAIAEGIDFLDYCCGGEACACRGMPVDPVGEFWMAWNDINGSRATWESNPWVWRVEFCRVAP